MILLQRAKQGALPSFLFPPFLSFPFPIYSLSLSLAFPFSFPSPVLSFPPSFSPLPFSHTLPFPRNPSMGSGSAISYSAGSWAEVLPRHYFVPSKRVWWQLRGRFVWTKMLYTWRESGRTWQMTFLFRGPDGLCLRRPFHPPDYLCNYCVPICVRCIIIL